MKVFHFRGSVQPQFKCPDRLYGWQFNQYVLVVMACCRSTWTSQDLLWCSKLYRNPTSPVPYVKQIHFSMSFNGLAVPVLDNLISSAKVEFVLRIENSSLPPNIVIGQEPFHGC